MNSLGMLLLMGEINATEIAIFLGIAVVLGLKGWESYLDLKIKRGKQQKELRNLLAGLDKNPPKHP